MRPDRGLWLFVAGIVTWVAITVTVAVVLYHPALTVVEYKRLGGDVRPLESILAELD